MRGYRAGTKGRPMNEPLNHWYRISRISGWIFFASLGITVVDLILPLFIPAAAAGNVYVLGISFMTVLISAIAAASTVILGRQTEQRQVEKFVLKIRELEHRLEETGPRR